MTDVDVARGERGAGLTRAVLRQRPIRRVVGAFAALTLGEWVLGTTVAIHAYAAGGALAVGLVGFRFVPAAAAGLWTTRFAGHPSREAVLAATAAARAGATAAAALALALDARSASSSASSGSTPPPAPATGPRRPPCFRASRARPVSSRPPRRWPRTSRARARSSARSSAACS